jgi:hypothetical protein
MLYLGLFTLLVACIGLLWNLHTSYETQAGAIGQKPVLGATVIQIPLLVMLGIKLLDDSGWLHLEWWYYPIIWLLLVKSLCGLMIGTGRLGKSKSKGFG